MVCEGQTYKLSLLPVGVLRRGITSVIANGLVINPKALLGEIAQIRDRNLPMGDNLKISDRAHVIFPWHMAEEALLEQSRVDEKIGTTMRGIGTCYRDKAGRTHAIRIGDLCFDPGIRDRIAHVCQQKNRILAALGNNPNRSTPVPSPTNTSATPTNCGPTSSTRRLFCTARCVTAGVCCSKVPRAVSWTSITARFPM